MSLPPGTSIALADPTNLIYQLPPSFISPGDFTKNALSRSVLMDEREQTISSASAQFNISLSNRGVMQHLYSHGPSLLQSRAGHPPRMVHP
jgi:hypothetical protein